MTEKNSRYAEKNTNDRGNKSAEARQETRTELQTLEKETKAQWKIDREIFGDDEKVSFWETLNYKEWGLTDYSEYSSFNSAFRNARENGEKEFMYKEKRYNSKLISKEHSDLYHESKKFLQDYYSQVVPNFKNLEISDYSWNDYMKELTGTNWSEYYDESIKNGTYETNWEEVHKKLEELSDSFYDIENNEMIYQCEVDKNYQEWATKKYRELFLKNLNNKNMYFSITNYKPKDMKEEGYLDSPNKKLFMYIPKDQSTIETTPIHELSHKSEEWSLLYGSTPRINVEKMNKNSSLFDFGQEGFDYLSQNHEIHARKMSTLFYLHKTGKEYRNLSMKNLLSLYGEKDLPSDVEQLLTLFQLQKKDLLDYLNNNEN